MMAYSHDNVQDNQQGHSQQHRRTQAIGQTKYDVGSTISGSGGVTTIIGTVVDSTSSSFTSGCSSATSTFSSLLTGVLSTSVVGSTSSGSGGVTTIFGTMWVPRVLVLVELQQ